jgi:hypothetical protein
LIVCYNLKGGVVVMLGDLEGSVMGTLQSGRMEDINVHVSPLFSYTFGLLSAVFGKGIPLIRRIAMHVAFALQSKR